MEAETRWEDNIKTDLREVGYDSGDWVDLVEERLTAGLCKGCTEPPGPLKSKLVS